MPFTAKEYARLLGTSGFSDVLLKNHFTIYQGFVINTDIILEIIEQMLKEGKAGTPEYAELKRRLGREFNGMRLHENYFDNLGGSIPLDLDSRLAKKLVESFGSIEAWEKDFRAMGATRDSGWTILFQDQADGRLFNFWINEHNEGHAAGGIQILVMDVFEHAYLHDHGLNRADYIEVFFKCIDWKVIERRIK